MTASDKLQGSLRCRRDQGRPPAFWYSTVCVLIQVVRITILLLAGAIRRFESTTHCHLLGSFGLFPLLSLLVSFPHQRIKPRQRTQFFLAWHLSFRARNASHLEGPVQDGLAWPRGRARVGCGS